MTMVKNACILGLTGVILASAFPVAQAASLGPATTTSFPITVVASAPNTTSSFVQNTTLLGGQVINDQSLIGTITTTTSDNSAQTQAIRFSPAVGSIVTTDKYPVNTISSAENPENKLVIALYPGAETTASQQFLAGGNYLVTTNPATAKNTFNVLASGSQTPKVGTYSFSIDTATVVN